jgi:hypothetical protein
MAFKAPGSRHGRDGSAPLDIVGLIEKTVLFRMCDTPLFRFDTQHIGNQIIAIKILDNLFLSPVTAP